MPRPGKMLYIIAYDFPSTTDGDRRRARLARYLEGIALRVQFSVFELESPPEQLDRITDEISDRIETGTDSVRIYPCCAACAGRVLRLGTQAPCEHNSLLMW